MLKLVGILMLTFRDRATETAEIAAVYSEAFSTFPAHLVERAIWEFVRGQVKGRNHAFAPSTAEVCARVQILIEEEARALAAEAWAQQTTAPTADMTDEQRAEAEKAKQRADAAREAMRVASLPLRMPWMKHPSWAERTREPEGGWKPEPDRDDEAA